MGGAIAEFDFEALEPPPPPAPPTAAVDEVMEVLAAARAEADQIRSDAYEAGHAAGYADALAALSPSAETLAGAVSELRTASLEAATELERRAVELALELAAKVVGGALQASPALVVDAVTGALRGLVERERVTVLVNPADLEIVREAIDDLRASLGGIEHCVVEAERRVGRGGCIVRTPVGDVDARVETKLERAAEVVAAALGRS